MLTMIPGLRSQPTAGLGFKNNGRAIVKLRRPTNSGQMEFFRFRSVSAERSAARRRMSCPHVRLFPPILAHGVVNGRYCITPVRSRLSGRDPRSPSQPYPQPPSRRTMVQNHHGTNRLLRSGVVGRPALLCDGLCSALALDLLDEHACLFPLPCFIGGLRLLKECSEGDPGLRRPVLPSGGYGRC